MRKQKRKAVKKEKQRKIKNNNKKKFVIKIFGQYINAVFYI